MEKELFATDLIRIKRKEQLGIFLLDGSGSMSEIGEANCCLAENVNRAFKDFVSFFKTSSIANEFQIAIINFDYEATIRKNITPLIDIDELQNYDPRDLKKENPGTNIGEALKKAETLINQFFSSPNPDEFARSVVIAIMSDGMCQYPDSTTDIARKLDANPNVIISTALFSTKNRVGDDEFKAAKNFLQEIKSTEGIYTTAYDEKALRNFFNASVSVSKKKRND